MELTEKERLMLVNLKEEIRKLTTEILELSNDFNNALEIKKRITSMLSKLSTIASYAKPKIDMLNILTFWAKLLFHRMEDEQSWEYVKRDLGDFCNEFNSMEFHFTKRGVKIHIPKIDISILRTK